MPSDPITLWIAQVKEGKREAVARLMDHYFQRLIALARGRLRAIPGLAGQDEDVALSAFKSFHRRVRRVRIVHDAHFQIRTFSAFAFAGGGG